MKLIKYIWDWIGFLVCKACCLVVLVVGLPIMVTITLLTPVVNSCFKEWLSMFWRHYQRPRWGNRYLTKTEK